MDSKLHPSVRPVLISDLRPTQMTVGLGEEDQRRSHWRQQRGKKAARFLGKHIKSVLTLVIADLRKLETAAFWFAMDNRGWLHPYDERGRRRSHTDLPNSCGPTIFPVGAGLLPTRTAWPSSGENN